MSGLFQRTEGAGPTLLLLQGGDGDADGMAALVAQLTAHFRVVTYDRRGLSRSKLEPGAAPPSVTTHAEDAAALLAMVAAGEPSFVFGASIGAMVGLELVSRHPDAVSRLVAHEPPTTQFLPADERARAARAQRDVEDANRSEGVMAAMRKFASIAGLDFSDREPDAQLPAPTPGRVQNLQFFLAHDAPAVRLQHLDEEALRAAASRIVVAIGSTSGAHMPGRCATELARWLGHEPSAFPGGHNGFLTHPRAFAARLRDVFR